VDKAVWTAGAGGLLNSSKSNGELTKLVYAERRAYAAAVLGCQVPAGWDEVGAFAGEGYGSQEVDLRFESTTGGRLEVTLAPIRRFIDPVPVRHPPPFVSISVAPR